MNYSREKERLIRAERSALARQMAAARATAEAVLEDMDRRLFYLSREDNLRLLNLTWWAEKYHVEVQWVIRTLVEHFLARFGRRKTKNGFGTRMATLAGRQAEEILLEELKKSFPDEEQLDLWMQERRWEVLAERKARAAGYDSADADDGVLVRTKSLLDFDYPSQYVRYYSKKIKAQRQELDREMARKSNRQFSYRDNPWL